MVEGMGQRRAARIAAAAELGRRILQAQAAETTTLVTVSYTHLAQGYDYEAVRDAADALIATTDDSCDTFF